MSEWLTNPWLGLLAAGALIPLIIEWLLRRRRRRIPFAAMRYLMNPRRRRKIRMQDRILLLLRCTLPVLLAAAIARPLLRPASAGAAGGKDRRAVLVLDATYSMGQRIGQGSAFQTARTMAQDVLRGLGRDAPVALVILGGEPRVVRDWTTDRQSVADAIDAAEISDGAGRMADAIDLAAGLAAGSPPEATVDLYLVSDLQRQTWAATPADPRDARAMLATLPDRCRPVLLDTGGGSLTNAYITRFEPVEKAMAVGMPVRFEVDIEVKNMPSTGTLLLSLFADEDRTAAATRPAEAKLLTREIPVGDLTGGRGTVQLTHTFLAPGEHLLRVQLSGDSLPADNQRFYLASVPADIEVLILDPAGDTPSAGGTFASPGAALRQAIAPATPAGFERVSRFAATVRRPGDVFKLADYAVVVLADVGRPDESLVARLEQYVRDGGRLLVFAGDAVDPYYYNSKLLRGGEGLLPCRLSAPAHPAAPHPAPASRPATQPALRQIVLSLDGTSVHPAVARVRQMARSAAPAAVSRSMVLTLADGGRRFGRPVAWLDDGSPLICQRDRPFGLGRVMLVGTSADASWQMLVFTRQYPILVQELLRYLVGEPDAAVNLQQGQPFNQPVLLSSQYLLLRRPDLEKVRLEPVQDGDAWRVDYRGTDRQGVYVVGTTPQVMARRRFVVNLRATEGDLSRLDTASLAGRTRHWGPGEPIVHRVAEQYSLAEAAGPILWAAFGLLAVETFLARRFGRRRR